MDKEIIQESSFPTEPACEGHNWELARTQPNYWHGDGTVINEEIALVICTFCGVVRKTLVRNL